MIMTIISLAVNLYTANIGLYVMEAFNYDTIHVALVNSLFSVSVMFMNLFAIKWLEKRYMISNIIKVQYIISLIAILFAVFTGQYLMD